MKVTKKTCQRRDAVVALLSLSLVIPILSVARSSEDSARRTSQADRPAPGVHDFDFLVGRWTVHHRKLKERLANNHE